CFVFFFQAEDGIRVATVTGVQTCALPISIRVVVFSSTERLPVRHRTLRARCEMHLGATSQLFFWGLQLRALAQQRARSIMRSIRSEERREGKSVDTRGRQFI